MVAFNFKKEFVPKILSRQKRSTIRSTQRCRVHDDMHLYTGQRTKGCKLLMIEPCIGTAHILFSESRYIRASHENGIILVDGNGALFEQEGFTSNDEMFDFFEKTYGLPYRGFLHVWGDTTDDR